MNFTVNFKDVSYESYIEIRGAREKIVDGLSHLTSNKTGSG